MADEEKKPMDADELSADDLQQVTGGSTPITINTSKTKTISLPTPPQENKGTANVGWDIAENSSS